MAVSGGAIWVVLNHAKKNNKCYYTPTTEEIHDSLTTHCVHVKLREASLQESLRGRNLLVRVSVCGRHMRESEREGNLSECRLRPVSFAAVPIPALPHDELSGEKLIEHSHEKIEKPIAPFHDDADIDDAFAEASTICSRSSRGSSVVDSRCDSSELLPDGTFGQAASSDLPRFRFEPFSIAAFSFSGNIQQQIEFVKVEIAEPRGVKLPLRLMPPKVRAVGGLRLTDIHQQLFPDARGSCSGRELVSRICLFDSKNSKVGGLTVAIRWSTTSPLRSSTCQIPKFREQGSSRPSTCSQASCSTTASFASSLASSESSSCK